MQPSASKWRGKKRFSHRQKTFLTPTTVLLGALCMSGNAPLRSSAFTTNSKVESSITRSTINQMKLQQSFHNIFSGGTPFVVSNLASTTTLHMAFVGGDRNNGNGNGGKGGNGDKNNNGPLDDWLPDPSDNTPESESDQQTRRQRADARLPINFRSDNGSREEEFLTDDTTLSPPSQSSALERIQSGAPSPSSALSKANPYLQVVSSLSPSEIISRFTLTANPSVQQAAKTTILGLIGTLPKMAFESTVVTTGAKLASLMFQLQMTGYMFKNAEYRMALSREFGGSADVNGGFLLPGGVGAPGDNKEEGEVKSVNGKIKVNYNPKSTDDDDDDDDDAFSMEVDASAFTSELRSEVARLKEELSAIRSAKDESIRKDLLTYIRTLPPQELQKLTNTMSDDVLSAMKGLVGAVMAGIDKDAARDTEGDNESDGKGGISPDTVMEQSGEAMAQLCMWQLVVGYNLRELEVREEMKGALLGASKNMTVTDDDVYDTTEEVIEDDEEDEYEEDNEPGSWE